MKSKELFREKQSMNAFQRMNTALMIDEVARRSSKCRARPLSTPIFWRPSGPRSSTNAGSISAIVPSSPSPGILSPVQVGGRNILFARDGKGDLKAMLNTCPHRGAQVCREKHGSAKSFQCFYHGWVFGLDGTLRSQPGRGLLRRGLQGAFAPPTCSRCRASRAIAISISSASTRMSRASRIISGR